MQIQIPGYKILREIGRGGMSTVYLAIQEYLDRQVALKIILSRPGSNQPLMEYFLKEGQILSRLNHENIVVIYELGIDGDVYFIAMEYAIGGNLIERIREGLSLTECISIVKCVARALGHAHDQGFVHRDVKPANILFREGGNPVLADFGIANSLHADKWLTAAGRPPGTPNYMSPEQLRGEPLDGRSDLYSLGVVFYEMLRGEPPFDADSSIETALKHINEPPAHLPEKFSDLQPIMNCLLAKEPADRFDNAAELIRTLDRSASDLNISLGEPRPRLPEPPSKRILLWSIAAGVTLSAGAAALAFVLTSDDEDDQRSHPTIKRLLTTGDLQLESRDFFKPKGDNA